MTRIKRELLLRDLCARLPYEPKIQWDGADYDLLALENCEPIFARIMDDRPYSIAMNKPLEEIKPYLRPMSSMTEEEEKEYKHLTSCSDYTIFTTSDKVVAWLDRKMFDHRGLIPNGLALEAAEGMYKLKE